ncbi:MAG TPA: hypothetical protein VD866_06480 [Urbifossiella sp.]|nr:hypothetical protein [Urbifossiella sp.]
MSRPRNSTVVVVFLLLGAAAAGQPDDPIAQTLAKAKEEYRAAVGKAQDKLLTAFAAQQKLLEETKKLKVADQIKLVDQIKAERKAFEASPAFLPASPAMRPAVTEYQVKLLAARRKCEAAFDKGAEGYRDRKDLDSAKLVLAQKAEFFTAALPADPRTEWVSKKRVFRRNDKGKWVEKSDQNLYFTFEEVARGPAVVEILREGPPRVAVRLYADRAEMQVNRGDWQLLDKGAWTVSTKE